MAITKERFAVSTEGMAELHKDRAPWALVKELIANVFDEMPEATTCDVQVEARDGGVYVRVEDDGAGFSRIDDAFTLLAPSAKRLDPTKRGRFNIGEKEILSLCEWGRVTTAGSTVYFPRGGGRRIEPNSRTRGTVVEVQVPWKPSTISATRAMLTGFIPPEGMTYRVNGQTLYIPDVYATTAARLLTVQQSEPGAPLIERVRKTTVTVREAPDGEGWAFEMGIPVQRIEPPFLIDVDQKMPLSQRRDTIRDGVLQDLYAVLLNCTIDLLPDSDAGAHWCQMAIEDELASEATTIALIRKRYGSKVVRQSSIAAANEAARMAGFHVVPSNATSGKMKAAMRTAGVQRALDVFPGGGGAEAVTAQAERNIPDAELTDAMVAVRAYAQRLSALNGVGLNVDFSEAPAATWEASYVKAHVLAQSGDTTGLLTFNVSKLGSAFFERTVEGQPTVAQTYLILHELAHERESIEPHAGEYVDCLSRLGALAVHEALKVGASGWGS